MTTHRRTTGLAVLAALAAGGCGGSDGADRPKTPAQATATPAAGSGGAGSDAARVVIRGFAYRPAEITVRAGDRVTWIDRDKSNHTVTFAKQGPTDIPNLRNGQRRTVRFARPGTYAYVCAYHPNMRGTVVVR